MSNLSVLILLTGVSLDVPQIRKLPRGLNMGSSAAST